jgi:predicted ATPase
MEGKRLIEKIRLRNILSFGDKGEEIELQPLNVLIGQNASGKSNFIDIFKLLRSLTQDKGLAKFVSSNGGISEWLWKGKRTDDYSSIFTFIQGVKTVNYEIQFKEMSQRLFIKDEIIEDLHDGLRLGRIEEVGFGGSLLEPDFMLPEETLARGYILHFFSILLFYTDLQTTRKSSVRELKTIDGLSDFLDEDAGNLALVLKDLESKSDTKQKIISYLKKFNPRIENYVIDYIGDYVQLSIAEQNLEKPISAMRLSDGTLRYLCLLAILCHPEPPPLICIEEPEVGLHPDILPTIAELLIDASKRTQLIVTTHSDILVSALSDIPEAVLVCEADKDGTHFKRLDKESLKEWLEEYSLGEVWLRGGIGGTRW